MNSERDNGRPNKKRRVSVGQHSPQSLTIDTHASPRGVWTNYCRKSFEEAILRDDRNLGNRSVVSGLPKSWKRDPPPKGSLIITRRSPTVHISPGRSTKRTLISDKFDLSPYLVESDSQAFFWDTSLLPKSNGPESEFFYLPPLIQSTTGQSTPLALEEVQFETPDSEQAHFGSSNLVNMAPKKSGRALQLEEGMINQAIVASTHLSIAVSS